MTHLPLTFLCDDFNPFYIMPFVLDGEKGIMMQLSIKYINSLRPSVYAYTRQ